MNQETENNVTLSMLGNVLKKHFVLLIVAFLLASVLMLVYQAVSYTPVYSATVSIYVHNEATLPSTEADDNAADRFNNLKLSEALMDDFCTIMRSKSVFENVSEKLGYSVTPSMVKITPATENEYSHIIYITAYSTDPVHAKEIADAVYGFGGGLVKQTTSTDALNVFEEASVPTAAGNARFSYSILVAGVLGAVVVYAVLLVICLYQERITDGDDVEKKLGLVFLGNIPDHEDVEKHGHYYRQRYHSYYAYGKNHE